MEHVRSMDDLMLQINGTKPNEAVMKIFNIIFPYDKPLPQGRGDELSLQGFYTSGMAYKEPGMDDCDPEVLRQRLEREAEEEKKRVLESNAVEDIQDLLDIKRQLMVLETVNNMHVLTIGEKDERIAQLTEALERAEEKLGRGMNEATEEHYVAVLKDNTNLRAQIT